MRTFQFYNDLIYILIKNSVLNRKDFNTPQVYICCGKGTATVSGGKIKTVNYSYGFTYQNKPIVIVSPIADAGNTQYATDDITTSSFNLLFMRPGSSSATLEARWLAIGQ